MRTPRVQSASQLSRVLELSEQPRAPLQSRASLHGGHPERHAFDGIGHVR